MAIYSYDQFEQAAKKAGLLEQFSDSDLQLAKKNADAGMSILKYKQDYANAATDEAKVLANLGAEKIRSEYGNYTGGGNGSGFTLNHMSPSSFQSQQAPTYQDSYSGAVKELWDKQKNMGEFTYDQAAPTYQDSYGGTVKDLWDKQQNMGEFTHDQAAPTYQDSYGGTVKDLWDKQQNMGEFAYDQAAPEYTSRYDAQTQQLINALLNQGAFSYDPNTDPTAQAYQKQYAREGQRATQDALAAASAATGGNISSYAVTAASQAGDYYAAQMADKIPELYQQAYGRYLDEYNRNLSSLGVLQNAEQADYSKFLNELNQYNTDRSFQHGLWQDKYNKAAADLQTALGLQQQEYGQYQDALAQHNADRNFQYGVWQDNYNKAAADLQTALGLQQQEYGQYQDALAQHNADRNFQYGVWQDNYNKAAADLQTALGLQQQEYGRYQDTLAQHNTDRNFEYGQLLDEISNRTTRDQEAYERSQAEFQNKYNMAMLKAEFGDYSGLKELGIQIPEASGNGGYYGGGTGYSGTDTTADLSQQDADGVDAASGLQNSVIDEVWYSFPGGVVTADGFAMLQNRFPGLTAQQLEAAGFSVSLNDGSGGRNRVQNQTHIMR